MGRVFSPGSKALKICLRDMIQNTKGRKLGGVKKIIYGLVARKSFGLRSSLSFVLLALARVFLGDSIP